MRHGEFLSLLGPSGCGKTTTLRLIAGFERPDEGEIRIGGNDVAHLPPYKRDVNTVFQSYALFPHLSVLDNVALRAKQVGPSKGVRQARARELLELVQPASRWRRANRRQLSGGQQQRVALARALGEGAERAACSTSRSARSTSSCARRCRSCLKRLQREIGITFVYVTHDQEEALAMSDRVAVMNEGRIEQLGHAARDLRLAGDPLRRRLHRRDELHRGATARRRRGAARADASSPAAATGSRARS